MMLNDSWRNKFYIDALQKHARDKVVLDMGTGTGILAYYALLFGAKFVYCFEADSDIARVAQSVLEKKFSKDRFKVVVSNFWKTNLDEVLDQKIDIFLSETVGPGLFDCGMITTWHCVKPYLTKDAISIPDRLHCDAWIYETCQLNEVSDTLSNCLYAPAIYDDDFVELLLQVDKQEMLTATQWQDVNKIKSLPVKQIVDVVSYSMSQGPVVTFMDHAQMGNLKASIDFKINMLPNSTIVIINKISFEDQTLYLKDAKFMPWKYAPSLGVDAPGLYEFSYQNHKLECMSNHEWKFKLVA